MTDERHGRTDLWAGPCRTRGVAGRPPHLLLRELLALADELAHDAGLAHVEGLPPRPAHRRP